MEGLEFKEKLRVARKEISLPSNFAFNDAETKELIKKSADASKNASIDEVWGARNLIIAMEELNELSQQISKFVRGKGDYYALVEELADVHLVLEYVYTCCSIDERDVVCALKVKKDRLKKILDDEGVQK